MNRHFFRAFGRNSLFSAQTLLVANLALPASAQVPAAYDGLKKTVSVDTFQAAEAVGGTVTADGLTAMLVDALAKDGRFVVVERAGIASIQGEQALGTAGVASAETAVKGGQLLGSSAIVRGAVIKYEAAASGGSLGIGGLPMGSLFGSQASLKRQTSEIDISLRLIDTTTGQVISTSTAQGTASANSADATLTSTKTGATFGGSTFANTPIGAAAQDAIVKAVDQIAAGMRNVPWSASVVDASDGKVYVSAGADRNVAPGLVLTAYHKGKVLTDPSTGAVLDVEMNKIGTIPPSTACATRFPPRRSSSGTAPARRRPSQKGMNPRALN